MLGAIIGDIVGSRFEFNNHKTIEFDLFSRDCDFTDDTICTIAVADWLLKNETEQIDFALHLQWWCRQFPAPMGGYGNRFREWIREEHPKPYESYGNGSAMRIAAVGWGYESLEETCLVAGQIAAVSHNHPEGIKGAQAVATAIFMARKGYSKDEISKKIRLFYGYDLNRTCREIRPVYLYNETCQATVPEAIIAFLDSTGFENAIRLAVSLGGDSDTLSCITGGIAEAFYGIPDEIKEKGESYLPEVISKVVKGFAEKFAIALEDATYFSRINFIPVSHLQRFCSSMETPFENSGLNIPFNRGDWLTRKGLDHWGNVDFNVFNAAEICKIFTSLIRAERFSDGIIGRFFEDGHMLKCLCVLQDRINLRVG